MLDQMDQETKEKNLCPDEFELPETLFIRDIENRVFQTIVLQCLAKIKGIHLLEGNFIDSILGRDNVEGIIGITAEQDSSTNAVNVKVELNINYGVPIPEKSHEIQSRVSEEITRLTGLHVSTVHVVIKNVILFTEQHTMSPSQIEYENNIMIEDTAEDDEELIEEIEPETCTCEN